MPAVARVLPVAVGLDHRHGEVAVDGWTEGSGRALARRAAPRSPTRRRASSSPTSAATARWPGPTSTGWPAAPAATACRHRLRGRRLARRPPCPGRSRSTAGSPGSSRARRCTRAASPWPRRWRARPALTVRSRMQVARVIPCLDVDRRPGREGRRTSSGCATPATRWSWPPATTPRAPTSWSSSTSRRRRDGRDTMVDVVRRTAEQVFIPFTVGGGIRSVDDARRLLRAGADKVSVNTAAVAAARADRARSPPSSARSAWSAPSTPGAAPTARSGRSYIHGGRTPTGPRRGRVGAARRPSAGRRRDPAHVDGPRRHPRRLRPRADAGRRRRRRRAGDRQRRRRHARPPGRRRASRAAPTPCWPRRSSTSASTPSPRPRPCDGRPRGVTVRADLTALRPASAARRRPLADEAGRPAEEVVGHRHASTRRRPPRLGAAPATAAGGQNWSCSATSSSLGRWSCAGERLRPSPP